MTRASPFVSLKSKTKMIQADLVASGSSNCDSVYTMQQAFHKLMINLINPLCRREITCTHLISKAQCRFSIKDSLIQTLILHSCERSRHRYYGSLKIAKNSILDYIYVIKRLTVLVSAVQQNDLVTHIHTSIAFQFFSHLGSHRISSRILCVIRVGPCGSFILNIALCICQSQTSNRPDTIPPGKHKFILSVSVL